MASWHLELVLVIIGIMRCRGDVQCSDDNREDTDCGTGDTSCHLTSQSFYSYVVRIWNTEWGNTSAHGSILSYTSILTNCAPFVGLQGRTTLVRPFDHLVVYGQKLRNETDPDWSVEGPNVCSQSRLVKEVIPHEKCQLQNLWDVFFNFALIIIDKPFLVFRQHSYPAIHLPNSVHVAIYYVVLVNVLKQSGCEIPLLYFHARQKPTFAKKMKVNSMRWLTECAAKLCEMDPFVYVPNSFRYPGQWPTYPFTGDTWVHYAERNKTVNACNYSMRKVMNFTMLCVYFPNSPLIKIGHEYMDIRSHLWTGGAPLVCNGTAIGLTAAAKDRSRMHTFRQDFYLINTFVRVWPWLMEKRLKYGQTWLGQHAIEKDMVDRGAKGRDDGPKPVLHEEEMARSWPDDGEEDSKNRCRRNELITSIGTVQAVMSVFVIFLIAPYS